MNNISSHPSALPKPFLSIPNLNTNEQRLFISPKKVKIFEFYAISDGCKKIYTNKNSLKDYGEQKILNPEKISFCNLFVNGILQPIATYEIEEGKLILKTDDVPLKDSPIILQMITI